MLEMRKEFVLAQIDLYGQSIARLTAEPEVKEIVYPIVYQPEEDKAKQLQLAIRLQNDRQIDYNSFLFVDRCINWRAEHGVRIQEFYTPRGILCYHGKRYKERRNRRLYCCKDHDSHLYSW